MPWLDRSLVVSLLASRTLSFGCADVSTGQSEGESVGSEGEQPRSGLTPGGDGAEGAQVAPVPEEPMTPLEALSVQTGLSDDAPLAGEVVQVFCSVEGLAEGQPPPATSWEIVLEPEDMEASAIAIDGDLITVTQAGVYGISCTIDENGWRDPTPAMLQVSPGAAVQIDTLVSPDSLVAGEMASVTCSGVDEQGNAITEGWELTVAPQALSGASVDGVEPIGLALKGKVQGVYEVACTTRWCER